MKANGCCECEDPDACGAGLAQCSALQCPSGDPIDEGDGCCSCPVCDDGTIACSNIACSSGQAVEVTDGCCECAAASDCNEETQAEYDAVRDEAIEQLGSPRCEADGDCELVTLETRCRVECSVALHERLVDDLGGMLAEWAGVNCASCPEADLECPDPDAADNGVRRLATCVDGQCQTAVFSD
jgi:hypothetical protein